MNTALRGALALLFAASAVAKAADFTATSAQMAQALHLADGAAAALVAALVMGEAALAGALLLAARHERAVAALTAGVLAVFLAVAGWMQLQGLESCGCFGTRFALSPAATLAKNLVMLLCAGLLWRRTPTPDAAISCTPTTT